MSGHGEDEGYNDSHRAFLQALMARSTMTLDEAKPVLAAIFSVHDDREVLPEDITQADLSNVVAAINTSISPLDLEIRNSVHQTKQTRVYALVNTTSDALMQLATTYSADEIAFVKRVLDTMFEKRNTARREIMAISSMEAIQLAKAPAANGTEEGDRRVSGTASQGVTAQSLTMKDAEGMMQRLVEEGWLEESRRGYFSLSPRALMELRGWLIATYNDDDDEEDGGRKIKMCLGCKDIVTVGQRCSQRHCLARLHDMCTRSVFRVQKSETCPLCKTPWTGENFVDERAVPTDRPSQGRRRSGINGAGSSIPLRGGTQVDGAADEDDGATD